MGLDQYIKGKHFKTEKEYSFALQSLEHCRNASSGLYNLSGAARFILENEELYNELKEMDERVCDIRQRYCLEDVIDLRKANAIHHWMVDNVYTTPDVNCVEVAVTKERMTDLLHICKSVLTLFKKHLEKASGGCTIEKDLWEYEYLDELVRQVVMQQSAKILSEDEIDNILDTAAEACEKEAETYMEPGYVFFGNSDWDARQFNQTHIFVRAIEQFNKLADKGDYTLYSYDCWY